MFDRAARGFALFVNWFNGVAAVVCGVIMMLSVLGFPAGQEFMPLSIFENFPLREVFFTSLFWPGLALLLVNGLPNVIALVLRFRGSRLAAYRWGIAAGIMLLVWTGVEMVYIPNPLTVFYLVLGLLQTTASWWAQRTWSRVA